MIIRIHKRQHNTAIKTLNHFTWFMAFPLFGLYALVPGTKYSWATGILIFTFLVDALDCINKKFKLDLRFFPIVVYTLIQTVVIMVLLEHGEQSLSLKVAQWILYILIIAIFGKQYYDEEMAFRFLKICGVICAVYMLLQQVLYWISGYPMKPGIPVFPYVRDELKGAYDYLEYSSWAVYRPRSFFSEPATFCQFELLALTVTLFKEESREEERKSDLQAIIIMTLGILISKSTAGFLCLAVIAVLFGWANIICKKRISKNAILAFFTVLPVIVYFLFTSDAVQFQLERLSDGLGTEQRFLIFDFMNTLDMSSWPVFLFGHGFSTDFFSGVDQKLYLAGFLRHFFCFGIIGLVVLFTLLLKMWNSGCRYQRMVMIIFLVLNIGSNSLHSYDVMMYFAVLAFVRGKKGAKI